jgi:hypothetical protein
MRPFTDAQLLELWEEGLVQHPVDRALSLLLATDPQQTRAGLAGLSVGQRDTRLLDVYRQSFGARMEGATACPACGSPLEFSLDAAQFSGEPNSADAAEHSFTHGEYAVRFRPTNSFDLAAAALCADEPAARQVLLERCVVSAQHDEISIAPATLPEMVSALLEERLAECDPQAEILLDLACVSCGHTWQESLDVAAFLWAQVNARARC